MNSDVLSSEQIGSSQVLTITREQAGNSISKEVTTAFLAALGEIRDNSSLRSVIITGAGERFFCCGGDIKQYRELRSRGQLRDAFARPRGLLDAFEALPLPVIAAVNGYALGGGAELMLACDLRFAAASAQVGFPYVRLSLIPGWHGIERLARDCGQAVAMQLLLSGEPVSADEALRLRLVNEVVDDGAVLDAALHFAARLDDAAPLSLGATKQVLRQTVANPGQASRALAEQAFEDLWMSDDDREAEAAFTEKRKPAFNGK